MEDLNDLYYFAQVVEHGGFAPAGRALNTPKSKLSRRISTLEERLGVRLLQRTTRRVTVQLRLPRPRTNPPRPKTSDNARRLLLTQTARVL